MPADGHIDDAEVGDFLNSVLNSALSVFLIAKVETDFCQWVSKINTSKTIGIADILQTIMKVHGKPKTMLRKVYVAL